MQIKVDPFQFQNTEEMGQEGIIANKRCGVCGLTLIAQCNGLNRDTGQLCG